MRHRPALWPRAAAVAETGSFGLFTSLSFDLTLTSLFCSLSRGGRLKVYPQQQELSSILADYLSLESGLDSIKLTPSHLNLLEGLSLKGTALKRAIVGGEALSAPASRGAQGHQPPDWPSTTSTVPPKPR
jgi:hypothetical protein